MKMILSPLLSRTSLYLMLILTNRSAIETISRRHAYGSEPTPIITIDISVSDSPKSASHNFFFLKVNAKFKIAGRR